MLCFGLFTIVCGSSSHVGRVGTDSGPGRRADAQAGRSSQPAQSGTGVAPAAASEDGQCQQAGRLSGRSDTSPGPDREKG